MMSTSNHLENAEKIAVEMTTGTFNISSYYLKTTMGAEYGDEAEAVRRLFEAAPLLLDVVRSFLAGMQGDEKFPGHNVAYLTQVVYPRAIAAMKNLPVNGERFVLQEAKTRPNKKLLKTLTV